MAKPLSSGLSTSLKEWNQLGKRPHHNFEGRGKKTKGKGTHSYFSHPHGCQPSYPTIEGLQHSLLNIIRFKGRGGSPSWVCLRLTIKHPFLPILYMASYENCSLIVFIILSFDSLGSIIILSLSWTSFYLNHYNQEGDMIKPHVVDVEDPLEHCMSLGKLAFAMMKMSCFLKSPTLSIEH